MRGKFYFLSVPSRSFEGFKKHRLLLQRFGVTETEPAAVCSGAHRGSPPSSSHKPCSPEPFWCSYSPGRQATPLRSTSGFTSLTMVGADRPPQAGPGAGDGGGLIAAEVSSRALTLLTGFNTSAPAASFLVPAPSDTIPERQVAVGSLSRAPPKRSRVGTRLGRDVPPTSAFRSSSSPRLLQNWF